MPSSTMTVRRPALSKTSRSNLDSAFTPPVAAESFSSALPGIPELATPNRWPGGDAWIRSESTSGQRWLVFEPEPEPAVMESPSATTVPRAAGASTSTPARYWVKPVVSVYEVAASSDVWSPPVRAMKEVW